MLSLILAGELAIRGARVPGRGLGSGQIVSMTIQANPHQCRSLRGAGNLTGLAGK